MYQLFGMDVSPYSVKVRAVLRFKALPHEWLMRNKANEPAFQAKAKLPLIPLLVTPAGQVLQDSTPIMSFLDSEHPTPSAQLIDPALNFLSYALEEAADEWLIKAMFHYRWNYEADRIDASTRLARDSLEAGADPTAYAANIAKFLMTRREPLGCTSDNADAIEAQLDETALRLDHHLSKHRFIFGEAVSFADFGLACIFYELLADPTPRQRFAKLSHIRRWVDLVMTGADKQTGQAAEWAALEPTLLPLLEYLLIQTYLPWARANAAQMPIGGLFTVTIDGNEMTQAPQKYPAKSWQTLQLRWQQLSDSDRAKANSHLDGLAQAMA